MASKLKYALVEKRQKVALVTINWPEKRNPLAREVIDDLLSAFEEVKKDHNIAVVMTTGAGEHSWSAGMYAPDLLRYYENPQTGQENILELDELIRNFPKVTMAVVNGYCLGAAITFLCSHDLAIASEERAKFGLPEIFRGFVPKYVVGALFKAVPCKHGMDLLLTGNNVDALIARQIGLVSRVAPHESLLSQSWKWAEEISRWDPLTLQYCKKAAYAVMEQPTYEQALQVNAWVHQEHNLVNPQAYQGLRDFIKGTGIKAK